MQKSARVHQRNISCDIESDCFSNHTERPAKYESFVEIKMQTLHHKVKNNLMKKTHYKASKVFEKQTTQKFQSPQNKMSRQQYLSRLKTGPVRLGS